MAMLRRWFQQNNVCKRNMVMSLPKDVNIKNDNIQNEFGKGHEIIILGVVKSNNKSYILCTQSTHEKFNEIDKKWFEVQNKKDIKFYREDLIMVPYNEGSIISLCSNKDNEKNTNYEYISLYFEKNNILKGQKNIKDSEGNIHEINLDEFDLKVMKEKEGNKFLKDYLNLHLVNRNTLKNDFNNDYELFLLNMGKYNNENKTVIE